MKEANLNFDWKTLYVGIEQVFFDMSVLTDYAIEQMSEGVEDELVNELAWGIREDEKEYYLREINKRYLTNFTQGTDEWNYECRKLRFAKIKEIHANYPNITELLEQISLLYDALDYPEDMIPFINYMPQMMKKKGLEPQDNLLFSLTNFMENEKIYLQENQYFEKESLSNHT